MVIMFTLFCSRHEKHRATFIHLVVGLVLFTLALPFLGPPPTASALTTAEQKYCYDTFNGKSFANQVQSPNFNNLLNIVAQPAGADNCVSSGACTRVIVPVPLGTDYSYSCTDPSVASSKSLADAEIMPLVTKVCGAAPTSGSLMDKYVACGENVRNVYFGTTTTTGCKYDRLDPVNRVSVPVATAAQCVSSKIPSISKVAAQAAIQEGQDAWTKAADTAANAYAKDSCENTLDPATGKSVPTGSTYTQGADGKFTCVASAATDETACGFGDTGFGDAVLSWFMCPLSKGIQSFGTAMSGIVGNFLYIAPDAIFHDNFKKSWNVFRNLGLGLVVIAGLFMVISQALGLDILDAYTIRKLMPRLAIAIIGISLSWPLLKLIVGLTNDIGLSLHDLILSPFNTMGPDKKVVSVSDFINIFGEWITSGQILGVAGAGAAAAGLLLGWAGVLSLFVTIALSMLIALATLGIRQAVVVFAVLASPLAIAAYVLPGTQKLWSFWKNTLITSLLMFPIVLGLLGATEALARILIAGQNKFLGFIVFVAGYAALPATFKMAGGLMSTIYSMGQDKAGGVFGMLKKQRQNKMGENWGKMKTGTRFTSKTGLGASFNKASKKAYEETQTFGISKKSRANRRAGYHLDHEFNEAMRIRKEQGHLMADDGVNEPLMDALEHTDGSNGSVERHLRANAPRLGIMKTDEHGNLVIDEGRVKEILAVSERLQRGGSKGDVMKALTMHNITTGSGYKDEEAMLKAIAAAAHGDAALATRMEGVMRGEAKQVGRTGLGGSRFSAQNEVLRRLVAHKEAKAQDYKDLALSSFLQTSASAIAQGRPEDVRVHTEAMLEYVEALRTKQPDEQVKLDDDSTMGAGALADKITAQLQNVANASREYGGLDRSMVASSRSSEVGMAGVTIGEKEVYAEKIVQTGENAGEKVIAKEKVPEYSPAYLDQLSRFGTVPGSPNDPNGPKPEPPKPQE